MDTSVLYEEMYYIRLVEEKLLDIYSAGKLSGTIHTCIGQEANAVAVLNAIDKSKDIVISNHRSHGHYLSYGGPLKLLLAEIYGKKGGMCRGIGGSQHLHYKNFYSNGVLGGTVAMGTGMSFAEKKKESGAIVIVFLGDGVFGEGIIYESFNIASLWSLPILFVVEKNLYAQSTPIAKSISGNFTEKFESFGIETIENKQFYPDLIYKDGSKLIDFVRKERKPACLIIDSYRLAPHSKGDDTRNVDELNRANSSDVLNVWLESLSIDQKTILQARLSKDIQTTITSVEKMLDSESVDLVR